MKHRMFNLGLCALFSAITVFLGASQALAVPAFWTNNGHYYEAFSGGVDWATAKADAENRQYLGLQGHLATLTSSAENTWVWYNVGDQSQANGALYRYYLGASDAGQEGNWQWVTGESWSYTNWDLSTPEPNNGDNAYQEDALSFARYALWNDLPDVADYWGDANVSPYVYGYIVEYEPTVTPEPASMLLFGIGLASLGVFRRRKVAQKKN